MDIQLVIFDLDGVIVDTAKYHYAAWKRLGDELGINFTSEDNERLKGVSRMRSLEIILEIGELSRTEEEKLILATKKNKWYLDYIKQMDNTEVLPGALNFIEYLRRRKIKIALGSASKNARTILERVGLVDCFDFIVDGNAVTKAKPDPEVFLLAAKYFNISPQKILVFEDAQAGIEAALKGEMFVIGIGDPEVLKDAHLVIPDFKNINLTEILRKLA